MQNHQVEKLQKHQICSDDIIFSIRNVIIWGIMIIVISSCSHDSVRYGDVTISSSLDSVLTSYIEQNKNEKIVGLSFLRICDISFFQIEGLGEYYIKNNIDGYFIKDGRLIVYNILYKNVSDSIIEQKHFDNELLKDYKDIETHPADVDHDAPFIQYMIETRNKFTRCSISEVVASKKKKNECIQSIALDSLVNEFTYSGTAVITKLRFNHIDGKDFVCISNDTSYEDDNIDGCFYYNGSLVVVYSYNSVSIKNLIEFPQIECKKILCNYKKKQYGNISSPEIKYEIISSDSIVELPWDYYLTMEI